MKILFTIAVAAGIAVLSVLSPPLAVDIRLDRVYLTNMVLQVTGAESPTNCVYRGGVPALSGRLTLTSYVGNIVRLSWPTESNAVYFVEWSSMNMAGWQQERVTIVGDGRPAAWVADAEAPRKFYRVRRTQ